MHPNDSARPQEIGVSSIDAIKDKHLRILVVDDEDRFREALSVNLSEKYDAVVIDVDSGGDAVRLLESGGAFDLIFLDLVMPGMSGTETYERLKNIDANCSIVMMSSHSDSPECVKAEKLAGGLMSKPDLVRTLAKVLSRAVLR